MKSDFNLFIDQFIGVRSLADSYGVEGVPAAAANAQGFVFDAGDAIHFGNNRQLNPRMLSKVKFELLINNTADSDNTVPDGSTVFCGLVNADFNVDPVGDAGTTKYILFSVGTAGAASGDIHVMASDGVTTYDEVLRQSDSRSREYEIDLASGVEDVFCRVGGKPAHSTNGTINLEHITEADRMQPVVCVVGANVTATLSQIEIRGRRSLLK